MREDKIGMVKPCSEQAMVERKLRTLVVEDHQISWLGMQTMLQQMSEIEVVGHAADGPMAVEKALELAPTLVLMDIGLPGLDGIEATKQIKKEMPCIKVILLTSHDDEDDIFAGLSAGADSYCLKSVTVEQLRCAVSSAMEGAIWLDPGITKRTLGLLCKPQQDCALRVPQIRLSERETAVLGLLVDGFSNQEIASRLYLSSETIKTHIRHIMEKLQVTDRTQAAVKAVRYGLVKS